MIYVSFIIDDEISVNFTTGFTKLLLNKECKD